MESALQSKRRCRSIVISVTLFLAMSLPMMSPAFAGPLGAPPFDCVPEQDGETFTDIDGTEYTCSNVSGRGWGWYTPEPPDCDAYHDGQTWINPRDGTEYKCGYRTGTGWQWYVPSSSAYYGEPQPWSIRAPRFDPHGCFFSKSSRQNGVTGNNDDCYLH